MMAVAAIVVPLVAVKASVLPVGHYRHVLFDLPYFLLHMTLAANPVRGIGPRLRHQFVYAEQRSPALQARFCAG